MNMKLFLLRHGYYVEKENDIILSDKGHSEAKALANKLQEIHIDKIYVSDYTRALETLEPFKQKNPNIPIVKTSDLREIYRVLVGGPIRKGTPKEREINDSERAERMWKTLKQEKGNIAVFVHGNLIKYFLMKALNIQQENLWSKMLIRTCSISIIEIKDKLIRVNAINSTDHLI